MLMKVPIEVVFETGFRERTIGSLVSREDVRGLIIVEEGLFLRISSRPRETASVVIYLPIRRLVEKTISSVTPAVGIVGPTVEVFTVPGVV